MRDSAVGARTRHCWWPLRMHGRSRSNRGPPKTRAVRGGQASADTRTVTGRRGSMLTILIVIAVLMLLGALPTWPHSRNWGYFPSGGLGLVLLILVILVLTGRL
jgi:hypothetical protein